jgi:four helix bundle protein
MLEGVRKIKAWELGHNLAVEVYRVTKCFPRDEQFGLTSQLRRAAVSVPANIVEGSQRQYLKEYLQFLYTSKSSLAEVEYLIFLAEELSYLSQEDFQKLVDRQQELGRTLHGLIVWLERRLQAGAVKKGDLHKS